MKAELNKVADATEEENTGAKDYRGRSIPRRPIRDKRRDRKRHAYGKDRHPKPPSRNARETYHKGARKMSKAPTQQPAFLTPRGAVLESDSEYFSYESSETSETGWYNRTKKKQRSKPKQGSTAPRSRERKRPVANSSRTEDGTSIKIEL